MKANKKRKPRDHYENDNNNVEQEDTFDILTKLAIRRMQREEDEADSARISKQFKKCGSCDEEPSPTAMYCSSCGKQQ